MDELRSVAPGAVVSNPLPNRIHWRNYAQAGQSLLVHLVIWIGAVAMIMPFVWMLSTSLKSEGSAMAYPPEWIPNPIHWSNYVDVVQSFPFATFAFNSVKIALLGTLGQLLSTS